MIHFRDTCGKSVRICPFLVHQSSLICKSIHELNQLSTLRSTWLWLKESSMIVEEGWRGGSLAGASSVVGMENMDSVNTCSWVLDSVQCFPDVALSFFVLHFVIC